MNDIITGELSAVSTIEGTLSTVVTIIGTLTVPDRIIPSNYGLITWNGSYLTVS